MRPRTIAGLLQARAETTGNRLAIRLKHGSDWVEWTWADYWTQARTAGAALQARGIRPGDHLILVVPEVEDAVRCLFGVWALGAVPTLVGIPYELSDPAAYLDQLRVLAARLDARGLIVSGSLAGWAGREPGLPFISAEELNEPADHRRLPDPNEAPARL